jgi:hypothetical protein
MESRHFGSYDRPLIRAYTFPQVDFGGAGNVTHLIPVPKLGPAIGAKRGLQGRVLSVEISRVTEDFAGSTSDSAVQVGDGSDVDKYFDSGLVLNESVDIGEVLELVDDGAAVDIEAGRSSVTVTAVASVGTPTGIADVTVVIAWW